MNVIVIGQQGSGKGTQAELLAEKFDMEHFDMGSTLREIARQDTPLGKRIYEIQNVTKTLVPDDMLEKIFTTKLNSIGREDNIVFDGIPRTFDQAKVIERELLASGRKIDKVFFVNIPEEVSLERISKRWVCEKCGAIMIMGRDVKNENEACPKCGGKIMQRKDDTVDGVKKRLSIFNMETMPVINYFKEKGLLVEISGNQPIEKVFAEITANMPTND